MGRTEPTGGHGAFKNPRKNPKQTNPPHSSSGEACWPASRSSCARLASPGHAPATGLRWDSLFGAPHSAPFPRVPIAISTTGPAAHPYLVPQSDPRAPLSHSMDPRRPSRLPSQNVSFGPTPTTAPAPEPSLSARNQARHAEEVARVISPLLSQRSNPPSIRPPGPQPPQLTAEAVGFLLTQRFRHYFIASRFSEASPGLSPLRGRWQGAVLRLLIQ